MPLTPICPVCARQDITLRQDGTLRNHREPWDWGPCEGSHLPPELAEVPDLQHVLRQLEHDEQTD